MGKQRDSDFEFFKLTLLSCQLNHAHFSIVKSMDVNELYHQAKNVHKVAFNKYQSWIENEI